MMRSIVKNCFLWLIVCGPIVATANDGISFIHHGDGNIRFGAQSIQFRAKNGYLPSGLAQIDRIFGVPPASGDHIERRLIEWLDHIQDRFGHAPIVLRSGYRSRGYNNSLRKQGKLAAQSSMHIEAGAIDMHLQGVASSTVAEYARSLNYGGVGYYHGTEIHLDVGPARFWDEKTSGTESNEPQRNAVISASTELDRCALGDTLALRLMRITEYPIGVPASVDVVCADKPEKSSSADVTWAGAAQNHCTMLGDYRAARSGRVTLPRKAPCDGALQLRLTFCHRVADQMPAAILSNRFWME